MTKNILLSLFFVSIFLYGTINESVYANLNDRPQPLEQFLPQIGYKTIEAAIKDSRT
ncbi:hypothetical protein ACQKNX_06120 [Lysinibacillus sp. NPDC093712]|uniref:hypothetical protein n=1 Tax=Lysinibacillus sp. NPDC093712 TaxID=3390579 RepID=UPI003D027EEE